MAYLTRRGCCSQVFYVGAVANIAVAKCRFLEKKSWRPAAPAAPHLCTRAITATANANTNAADVAWYERRMEGYWMDGSLDH